MGVWGSANSNYSTCLFSQLNNDDGWIGRISGISKLFQK